ncbi:MAG: carbamoyltransferase HypF [Christensenellales bacterium]|jgi:hydrogenase maturation protein HypF
MTKIRRYIEITGIIQGVGFRPFIYRTAMKHMLNGYVKNDGAMVIIDIEGNKDRIDAFIKDVRRNAPDIALIESIHTRQMPLAGYKVFCIEKSGHSIKTKTFISPDIAICEGCIQELADNNARKYQYPFTNCTACGPRYSILKALPYDRENMTMSVFDICESCGSEYSQEKDRRFHAQTNCCPYCGPVVTLLNTNHEDIGGNKPIIKAVSLLMKGNIIAIKGIGGYHLCCDAQNIEAVRLLRRRKNRPDRPLAVMARDIPAVNKVCEVSAAEEAILTGTRRPIILLKKRTIAPLPDEIAPAQKTLGIMLPYTPLHYLLFQDGFEYLVMTSGNVSGMPICYRDRDAFCELRGIADYFLIHNRNIHVPVDDSVVRIVNGKEMISRCGRGYAPATFPLKTNQSIIALGAEQKSSVTLVQNGYGTLSQYLGELKTYEALSEYEHVIGHLKALLNISQTAVVHDLNSDYLSFQYAQRQTENQIAVQHHHAHMASCIAEHGLDHDVIGVIYDGTGLGTDGAVWGGEFFVGNTKEYTRAAHWKYVTLQGGDLIVKHPWRCAVCYLNSANLNTYEVLNNIDENKITVVNNALKEGIMCCQSSSMGRLFDAVAAIVGLRDEITYNAQAAIELEAVAEPMVTGCYGYYIEANTEQLVIGYGGIIRGIVEDVSFGFEPGRLSAKFHNTVIAATAGAYAG